MDDKVIAEGHIGVGIGILGVALLGGGWAMWVLGVFSALFTTSGIVMRIRTERTELVKKLLRKVAVDFLPIFLGLVSLGMAILQKVSWRLGLVVVIVAFLYLYLRIYKQQRQRAKRVK